MKSDAAPSETRLWQIAARHARQIEKDWADPLKRERAIIACRHWLQAQEHLPRLAGLARLLEPQMTLQQLWALLAPVERAAGRGRVTDVTILAHDTPPAAIPQPMPLIVVADNIRSAFNVGGLFRTADCLGASALWLCGYSATPENRDVAVAAMGSAAHLPWKTFGRVEEALARLAAENVWTLALETVAEAPPLQQTGWRHPCAILLGNERFGLDPAIVAACSACARIPTYGYKNSLNVVSALAIAGWCARCAWEKARHA